MITEILYEDKPMAIKNGGHDIYSICLKICTNPLSNNKIWDSFFPYKLLKNIEIHLHPFQC